jgi:hypothetical protein
MATVIETWYVRLPSGRTVRVRSTDVVRRLVRAGRIPVESRARRTGENRWRPLRRIAEFAAVLPVPRPRPTARVAAPSPPPGVRAVTDELLKAADNTLSRPKMTIAALTGVALAVGVLAIEWAAEAESILGALGAAVFILAAVALAVALVTRMTLRELDRRRAGGAANAHTGLLGEFLRILAALVLVTAVVIGLLLGVRAALAALTAADLGDYNGLRDALTVLVAVVRVLVEVFCWAVLALAGLLLGPLMVTEESPIRAGLRDWLEMLRRHLGRVYLYEALALVVAGALALPALLLVGIAAYAIGDAMGPVERGTLLILGGAASAPWIAYLIVANVFVYINLRYECYFAARQR